MAQERNRESNDRGRLDSWDLIAQYLGRSGRTIQRWHAAYGLPIHRIGGESGPVFAFTTELDEWMWNRGRDKNEQGPASRKPVLLPVRIVGDSAGPSPVPEGGAIPESAKLRSAELVSFANQMCGFLSHTNIPVIARLFREAIDWNLGNVDAFAGLAMVLILEGVLGDLPISAAIPAAHAALQRAREIEPNAHRTICPSSWLKMILEKDWPGSREGFDEASELSPRSSAVIAGQALLQVAADDPEQASLLLKRAISNNPLDTRVAALHCLTEYLAGHFTKALVQIREERVCGNSGPILDAVEALIAIQSDEPEKYVPKIEALHMESPDHLVLRGALAHAYAASGQAGKARDVLNRMMAPEFQGSGTEPYAIAIGLLGLNEKQKAVQWLEKAYTEGSLWSLGFPGDPMLAPLRNDPHFRLFWSKVSYPETSVREVSLRFG